MLAEGAETQDEVQYLAAQDGSRFQGCCFSRPIPAAAFQQAMDGPAAFIFMQNG